MKDQYPDILYVDDEPSNLRIFRDNFRRDFEIVTALSAKEALKAPGRSAASARARLWQGTPE